MINNSALNKWVRLQQKDLNHQFIHELIHGLNCSPFEANAVLDAVYRVFGHYFETYSAIKPGQILFPVVATANGPQIPLHQCQQLLVTLTLDQGQEDLRVKEVAGVIGLRRHRIERVCHEAFQQGGLLTVEDLANRLFNCGERTLCRDLLHFRRQNLFIPLRSTVKDMGRTLSHYAPIISQWLAGKEYSQVAQSTCHSIAAVRNYIEKFKRVVALDQNQFDLATTAFLAKVSPRVAEEYLRLYRDAQIVDYRRTEIQTFLKNDIFDRHSGGAHDQASG
jgi:hypothetical protein